MLKQGVAVWNAWRIENPNIRPDLSRAALVDIGVNLSATIGIEAAGKLTFSDVVDLSGADHRGADLRGALLMMANFGMANLSGANLSGGADLSEALALRAPFDMTNLSGGANLSEARFFEANLSGADLSGGVDLANTDLFGANLSGANVSGARFVGADLTRADLTRADISGANLQTSTLLGTDFTGATLTGCHIYGISAWSLKLEGAKQQNLVITDGDEPEITVDNIEVAQFIYLLLHNQKIRDVIDTITSKAVLILGRFTDERKAVLDALRDELRKRNLLPILFDFAIPASRDVTETVKTLAGLARFVIADVTDATEVRVELHKIVPDFTSLAVQPILLRGHPEFVSLSHLTKFPWVLPIFEYDHLEHLLASLDKSIIAPAEAKVKALQERRRMIEAELTKPE